VLLLLDEPTTGLDPRSKLEVQEFIKDIREEHDTTILLCTHDMVEAEILAERVGILERGRLLCLAPVEELLDRFEAETVEQAFLASTGRSVEDDDENENETEQPLEVKT
jgi:ABC-2 type transport system ATP-binding protein